MYSFVYEEIFIFLSNSLNWYPEIPGTVIFGLVAVLGMRTQKEADMVIGNKLSSMISAIF